MAVDIKVTGLEGVETLVDQAAEKLEELRKVLYKINAKIRSIGLEINQPTDEPPAD